MEILILLKANLKHRKSSFISVFILMMIVSTILTSALSIADNVTRRVSEANDDIGTGDLVVFIGDTVFSDKMRSKLEKSEAVEKIKVIDSFFSSDTTVNGIKPDTAVFVTAYDSGDKPYGIFNDAGNAFISDTTPLRDGEIYLPIGMKKNCSCEKGDIVSLRLSGRTVDFKVAGFVEDPFVGCDVLITNNLFITPNDLNDIRDEIKKIDYSALTEEPGITPIKLVHIFAASQYKNDINGLSRTINIETGILDESFDSLNREQTQTYTLLLPLLMIGAFFLLLAVLMTVVALVLSNNIGTSIEMEYVNIGILKSQGLTKGKLRTVFVLQYLLPAVLGAVAGLLFSLPFIEFIRPLFITVSCMLVSNKLLLGSSVTVLVAYSAADSSASSSQRLSSMRSCVEAAG